ncbi:MAG: hypothetical protein [Circular genetic element sp.]|nr:MAG: hypothetical protein [Circular genetic element sp.]
MQSLDKTLPSVVHSLPLRKLPFQHSKTQTVFLALLQRFEPQVSLTAVSDSRAKHLKLHHRPSSILESLLLTISSLVSKVAAISLLRVLAASCTATVLLHLRTSMRLLFNPKFSLLEGI